MRKFLGGVGVLAVVVVVVVGAVFAVGPMFGFTNPLAEKEVDRTGPSVLRSLSDLSEYHAASGHYETVVDLENDSFLPGVLKGERVIYVAKGDVDALVDFGALDENSVTIDEDRTTVSIELPAPAVGEPVLDIENSYVVDSDEGLLDIGGEDLERDAQIKAIEQMTTAASGEGTLTDLARTNTESMLRGLLGSLGFTDIEVTFAPNPR